MGRGDHGLVGGEHKAYTSAFDRLHHKSTEVKDTMVTQAASSNDATSMATSADNQPLLDEQLSSERILVLDFGSQYAQLIARRVREQNVFCEIVRHDLSAEKIAEHRPAGIILSGGPSSVYQPGAPRCDPELFQLGIPVLGICYGMQLACEALGARVSHCEAREYGRASLTIESSQGLLDGLPGTMDVWMSHGDQVESVSDEFMSLAATPTCPVAAVQHRRLPVYGLQFHPEVTHTPLGGTVLHNFLYVVCNCVGKWHLADFAETDDSSAPSGIGWPACGLRLEWRSR
jgi:GMP synthase (glutamine-hydrolysing)